MDLGMSNPRTPRRMAGGLSPWLIAITAAIIGPVVAFLLTQCTSKSPEAVLDVHPVGGTLPLTVTFDASRSKGSDGNAPADYQWILSPRNGTDPGPGQVIWTHSFTEKGMYRVQLTVEDDDGEQAMAPPTEIQVVSPYLAETTYARTHAVDEDNVASTQLKCGPDEAITGVYRRDDPSDGGKGDDTIMKVHCAKVADASRCACDLRVGSPSMRLQMNQKGGSGTGAYLCPDRHVVVEARFNAHPGDNAVTDLTCRPLAVAGNENDCALSFQHSPFMNINQRDSNDYWCDSGQVLTGAHYIDDRTSRDDSVSQLRCSSVNVHCAWRE